MQLKEKSPHKHKFHNKIKVVLKSDKICSEQAKL